MLRIIPMAGKVALSFEKRIHSNKRFFARGFPSAEWSVLHNATILVALLAISRFCLQCGSWRT
ncbi:hypothetical protein ABO04_00195 [Nitrosomonas sp. HPC101]|nr:hypothetical protein [Nitrosomonas sp. HPC101]